MINKEFEDAKKLNSLNDIEKIEKTIEKIEIIMKKYAIVISKFFELQDMNTTLKQIIKNIIINSVELI